MFKTIVRNQFFVLLLLLFTGLTHASFYKSLWPQWEVNNPLSKEIISHQLWQDFLNRRIITSPENINLVDYAHFSQTDLNLLKDYLRDMAQINIDNYNRAEQLA